MATTWRDVETTYRYPGIAPMDVTAGVQSNYFSMKNYNHATIDIIMGAIATPSAVTIKRATTVDGGSAETWTGWDYVYVNGDYSEYDQHDTSDTEIFTKTSVTSYTKNTAADNHWVIEIDAIDLGGGAWDCFGVAIAAPSATDLVCILVTLSGARYADATPPSARSN